MDDDQQFCLRWNNHQSTLISVFDTLLENGTLVDCTLAAEGKFLKAHKVVLSACSPYFAALLSQQYDKHPIFILKDVKFQELRAMMDYMYRGEVNISQDQLAALLKAAESLQIKGLSDNRGSTSSTASSQQKQQQSEASATKTLPPPVPVNKASGLTIENKRPLKSELLDSDVSGSREGSTSPTSRKRKKIRRRSVETNNVIDNHDQHSNSSSHSMHTSLQPQALALTSSSNVAAVPATNNAATSLSSSAATPSSSANVLASAAGTAAAAVASAALKKTESAQQQQVAEALKLQLVKQQQQQQSQQQAQNTDDDDEPSDTEQGDGQGDDSDNEMDEPQIKRQAQGGTGSTEGPDGKSINQSELMIEPKNEYDDGQDENVEDLTLDEEELLDDLDQAGPSHGEGSSQGYAQWQMEREQNEAFMAAQDAVGGQHRDAQGKRSAKSPAAATTTVKKIRTITVTTPQTLTATQQPQSHQITSATPIILNTDLNDCLLESKNIVVSKKDNKYILFTTAASQPPPLQPATTVPSTQVVQSVTLQPLVAAASQTVQTATVIDTGRIEELLKKDKIIKKTELQGDGTTTTTYIFDECDILPLKSAPKEPAAAPAMIETISLTPQQSHIKPTTISIVKVGAGGEVVTTSGTAVIPVGTALVTAQQQQQQQTNAGASGGIGGTLNQSTIASIKKPLKPSHPRIKYSKHKNPSAVQTVTTLPILTIPTVTTSSGSNQSLSLPVQDASAVGTTTKIELLNFSLSRKFPAHGGKTIDVSNVQQIPISAISKPVTARYTVNEYETSASNTSQSNDFPTGMIDDLDYSVIDDIELPDDVQVNFADSYTTATKSASQSGTGAGVVEMEDDEDGEDDSQDPLKSSSTPVVKKLIKSDAKILNASMDDKYALLANTSIMKNFEYTVNESVVSDNDENEMRQYICRHCGKRYRWKSTLRRHENVECGGKEAMHQCPYCTYKAKQRGNLGVHIRKHHADMPQLESRRKSKNRDSLNLIESIKAESEGQL